MINLTSNEIAMLKVFVSESLYTCGACDEDENMSYCNAKDLQESLGGSIQSIGGVMASLLGKGLISDTFDSARHAPINDFVVNTRCPEVAKLVTELA